MSKVRTNVYLFVSVFCVVALSSGCPGDSKGTAKKEEANKEKAKKEDTRSKVEYFRDTQGPSMTPYGKIKMDTVQPASDGKVQYQTEDGKTWRVEMTKQADGTYRYGTPVEVKNVEYFNSPRLPTGNYGGMDNY
jgi:hypothetical protein